MGGGFLISHILLGFKLYSMRRNYVMKQLLGTALSGTYFNNYEN